MPLPPLPLIIDTFSFVLVFLRQGTGWPHGTYSSSGSILLWASGGHWSQFVSGCCVSVGEDKVPNTQSRVIWKGWEIALDSWQWHAKQQGWRESAYAGGIGSKYQSLEITQGAAPWWLKAPRSLEPTFKAGAQPRCCAIAEALHGSMKIIINNGCKSAWFTIWVQIAEAARGARLHEEVDMCCGSGWVGAPRGVLRAALSFSICHLHPLSQHSITYAVSY